jgi:hypothetical protein
LERLSLYESFIKGPAKVNKGSKPGYAEREGQLTDKTSEVKFLEKAQEKLQEKNLEAALKIVEEGLASNVYSSSLTLMKLRLLANSAGGLSLNDLSEAKERFSRDIRFSLLELSLARSTEDIEVQLDNLFSVLETSPRAAIKFFGPQICQQLVQLATRNNSLVGKILPYLRYYQHDARLNHTLAEAASNLGMHDCALVLFDWLIQAKEIAGADNSKFLNELDMNYLNTKKSSAESMAATLPLAISSDEMRET